MSQLRASHEENKPSEEDDEKEKEKEDKLSELNSKLEEKDSEITRLTNENEEHVKRVAELTAYIQQASQDREQIIQQYTSYSQQLATQIETLTQQLHSKALEVNNFSTREADLLAHVERLEGQLQNSMKSSDGSVKMPSTDPEMASLRLKLVSVNEEVVKLQKERNDHQESLHKMVSKKSLITALKSRVNLNH